MDKNKRSKSKFSEWVLMKQEVDQFERGITTRLKSEHFNRIRVFAVGSPRNFQMVVNAKLGRELFHKRFRRDIRDESHQFWLAGWDRIEWRKENHIISDSEL